MAVDMFVQLDKIQGETSDSAIKGGIDIISFSWGMTQTGTMHSGAGGGAGKAAVQDLTVIKYIDKTTPVVMKMCLAGTHIEKATLLVRKAGGKTPVTYMKIIMEKVLISGVQTAGAEKEERITETLTFNFAKVKVEYTPQKEDGSAAAAVLMGWDIAANKEIG